MTLRICDPHIHLWDLSTGLYPGLETPSTGFIGDNAAIARSYLPPELLAEAGPGLDLVGAVHVEAFPTDSLAEARRIQDMADAFPVPLGLVAFADLSAPDVGDLLAALAAFPALRGIRQVLNRHADPLLNYVARDHMDDPAWVQGYGLLARHGLGFDLQLYPHQAAQAARLVADHPATPVVLNHAGMWADRTPAGWRAWKAALRDLAALPHAAVKVSGLGMFDHRWTVESLRPLVLETIEAFGAGRTMFASNFPVDKLFGGYAALWEAFARIVDGVPAAERDALLSANAGRFYRLQDPTRRTA